MLLFPAILRLCLTAMLAFSTPLCLCAARANAAEQPASCCSPKPAQHACCAAMQPQDERSDNPCDHQGGCGCSKRPAYTAPATDLFTPQPPALLAELAWPPIADLLPAPTTQTRAQAPAPAALPRTPLLRQHCALII
jgi:hypothetical protein